MIEKKFKFISVKDLDKSYHKLVKSLLGKFIGNLEVISTEITSDEKYPVLLILEDGTELKNSLTHKYCVMNDDGFKMKQSQFIESGDLIALFEDTI